MTDNQVTIRKLISSTSSDYEVQELLGCGAYGAVTKCRKVATNEMVALKILKRTDYIDFAKEEAETLTWMKQLNSEKFNIVVLNDSFIFEGCFHLEFEKLDISLCQFMEMRSSDSLQLQEIRPIVQQLATALEFIKHAGVVHADLKPENIMMVDHVRQPLRIKIIDFGIACRDPEARTDQILQTLWYRFPEILLGAPFNTAIDTWSLGCIAAEMKLGKVLFPGSDEYDMLMKYCDVLSSDDGTETTSNSPALHPDEGHAAGQSEEEQLGLQSIRENSPAKKRKRDCSEDSESGNRSRIATKRRSQCQDAADTVWQTRPLLRKRQRDESDQRSSSDSNSQKTKKRRINLDKEPMERVTKLLSDTQEAPSSSTQVHSWKRKRADEEATSPEEDKPKLKTEN
ncbi:homeodomain-interacting protein kinase 1-like [Epinephelus fuscoguttatus]|uniref:homeodomain-interacting protein kinase 1-like n=1 Tax=Epinephelus fuscoguttatus TaxID=293821 RepID=UPI0020D08744|nr:homeodomain-interacting protein kinase 1-like [Epinephelus fuscoguttatus]